MRLERQLTTQSSGVGSKANVSAAAAVQRYNSRNGEAYDPSSNCILLTCASQQLWNAFQLNAISNPASSTRSSTVVVEMSGKIR